MLTQIAQALLGEVLVELGVFGVKELDKAVRYQQQQTQERISAALEEPQLAAYKRICDANPGMCPKEEAVPVTNAELIDSGHAPLPKHLPKGPSFGQALRELGLATPKQIELAGAAQAVSRIFLLGQGLGVDGVDKELLDKARLTFQKGREVSLKRRDAEDWLADAPSETKQAQSVLSMGRLLEDIFQAAAEEQTLGKLYNEPEMEDARRAIRALAYHKTGEVADSLEASGQKTIAEKLRTERASSRLLEFGDPKPGILAGISRGFANLLDLGGYKLDGTPRGGLGPMMRYFSWKLSSVGFETHEVDATITLVRGVQNGLNRLEESGYLKKNGIDKVAIDHWLEERGAYAGLEYEAIKNLFPNGRTAKGEAIEARESAPALVTPATPPAPTQVTLTPTQIEQPQPTLAVPASTTPAVQPVAAMPEAIPQPVITTTAPTGELTATAQSPNVTAIKNVPTEALAPGMAG